MACVAIASVAGLQTQSAPAEGNARAAADRASKVVPISQHDLEGVYLQPLEWRLADATAAAKVVKSSTR
jgi:hypothetical protein